MKCKKCKNKMYINDKDSSQWICDNCNNIIDRDIEGYGIYRGDDHFSFGSGYRIYVVYSDEETRIYDIAYDADITEYPNYEDITDELFGSEEEAKADCDRLETIDEDTCDECGCEGADAYTEKVRTFGNPAASTERGRRDSYDYVTSHLCRECFDKKTL